MKSKERDKSILEYVQCMYNNVHTLHFLISLQKIVISSFLNTNIQLIRKKKEKRPTTQIKKISL